jgi:hypothetical protein
VFDDDSLSSCSDLTISAVFSSSDIGVSNRLRGECDDVPSEPVIARAGIDGETGLLVSERWDPVCERSSVASACWSEDVLIFSWLDFDSLARSKLYKCHRKNIDGILKECQVDEIRFT